jgi:hypothetical protein
MKYAFAQIAFGLGANALVAREASQCFQLKASGGESGVLGQLDDGQNRVGGGHPTGMAHPIYYDIAALTDNNRLLLSQQWWFHRLDGPWLHPHSSNNTVPVRYVGLNLASGCIH